MTRDEYRQNAYRMIAYISVSLGIRPADELLPDPDELSAVFHAAQKHCVTAMAAFGLQKAGIRCEDFISAKGMAIQKSALYDMEAEKVFSLLENARIHYLPLKGMLIKKLYPQAEMREMADIDILFDKRRAEAVRDILLKEGYECAAFGKTNHDIYIKSSFYSLEMHRELFDNVMAPKIDAYYSQKDFLAPDGSGYRRRMSEEDLYIYLIAHMYLHYSTAGVGIRPLIDIYLYLKRFGDRLDFSYIATEAEKLSLTAYEASVRNLSQKLWDPQTLSDQEREELDYYIFSGVYGKKSQNIRNMIDRSLNGEQPLTKWEYIKKRFRLTPRKIQNSPFYSKHPRLAPLMAVTRPVKAAFTRPKAIVRELSVLRKADKK